MKKYYVMRVGGQHSEECKYTQIRSDTEGDHFVWWMTKRTFDTWGSGRPRMATGKVWWTEYIVPTVEVVNIVKYTVSPG